MGQYQVEQHSHYRGSEERRGRKLILRNNAENFPNLEKEINIQIQEGQRFHNKINPSMSRERHKMIKLSTGSN